MRAQLQQMLVAKMPSEYNRRREVIEQALFIEGEFTQRIR